MSKIDRVLLFAFSHQTVIIELIFAVILGIVVMWLFTNIRGESGESQPGVNVKDIEKALKKVLESTDIKVATTQAASLIKDDDDDILAPGAGIGGAPRAPSDPAEIAKLKVEMENKSKKLTEVETALNQAKEELTKAKAAGAVAGGGGAATPGVNTDELQAKIRSLESRLSEYEIIEDDIANLSLYKEENTKLKAEMNKLKGGSGEVSPTPTPTPAPNPGPVAAPIPTPAPIEAVAPGTIDSDKLVKEFDNLVARENSLAASENKTPPPAAPVVAAPAVNAPTTPSTGETGDAGEKLIEEFENFVKGTNT